MTTNREEYLACLKHDKGKFRELIRKDEAHWNECLETAKWNAKEIQEELNAHFERQQRELTEILKKSTASKRLKSTDAPFVTPWPKPAGLELEEEPQSKPVVEESRYSIVRLPLWGQMLTPGGATAKGEEINFEWPTQEMLDKLPDNVWL